MNALLGKKRPARARRLCLLALVTAVIFLLAQFPACAEYLFARGITRWLSSLIGAVTNLFPFSFYEWTAVILIAGGLCVLVGLIVQLAQRQFRRAGRWVYRLAAAALCVLLAFGLLYAPLYDRASVSDALALPEAEVNEQTVYDAAAFFVDRLNESSAKAERDAEGNAVSPHTFEETARLLNAQFASLGSDYFSSRTVRPKAVALSVPMSYLGITGIYFPFYAESNVNVNIPAYEIPSTMAHEMAHAKGVSREGDANVVSYVLCVLAEDDFLNYSGLMPVTARLLNSLPEEQFDELYARLDPAVKREYANASAHYDKYEGVIDSISGFFNDLFLKANGVPGGIRSYSETTESLVALYVLLSGQ